MAGLDFIMLPQNQLHDALNFLTISNSYHNNTGKFWMVVSMKAIYKNGIVENTR